MSFYVFVFCELQYNNRAKDLFYLLFLVISESSIYHTIIAAKLQIPKKMRNGMQTSRKMKLVLLSFHDRFLNLSENIGISDTSSHEKRQTSSNR